MRANIANKKARGAENNGKSDKPRREGREDRRKGSRARAAREGAGLMERAVKQIGNRRPEAEAELQRGAVCSGHLSRGERIAIVIPEE